MDEIIERGNRSEIGQLLRMARRQKAAAKGAAGSSGKMDPDRLVQVSGKKRRKPRKTAKNLKKTRQRKKSKIAKNTKQLPIQKLPKMDKS